MEEASTDSHQRLVCAKCREQASFISPVGLLCQTDALLAAVQHGWIPTQVRETDRSAPETSELDGDSSTI